MPMLQTAAVTMSGVGTVSGSSTARLRDIVNKVISSDPSRSSMHAKHVADSQRGHHINNSNITAFHCFFCERVSFDREELHRHQQSCDARTLSHAPFHASLALGSDWIPGETRRKRATLEALGLVSKPRAAGIRARESSKDISCDAIVIDSSDDEITERDSSREDRDSDYGGSSVAKALMLNCSPRKVSGKGTRRSTRLVSGFYGLTGRTVAKLNDVALSSPLGQRLGKHYTRIGYATKFVGNREAVDGDLGYESYCCHTGGKYLKHGQQEKKIARQSGWFPTTYKAPASSKLTDHRYSYKFTKRQREEFRVTLKTGLNARARNILRKLLPCSVRLLRIGSQCEKQDVESLNKGAVALNLQIDVHVRKLDEKTDFNKNDITRCSCIATTDVTISDLNSDTSESKVTSENVAVSDSNQNKVEGACVGLGTRPPTADIELQISSMAELQKASNCQNYPFKPCVFSLLQQPVSVIDFQTSTNNVSRTLSSFGQNCTTVTDIYRPLSSTSLLQLSSNLIDDTAGELVSGLKYILDAASAVELSSVTVSESPSSSSLSLSNSQSGITSVASQSELPPALNESMVCISSESEDEDGRSLKSESTRRKRRGSSPCSLEPENPLKRYRLTDSNLPLLTFECNECQQVIRCITDSAATIRSHYAEHGITNIGLRKETLPDGIFVLKLVEISQGYGIVGRDLNDSALNSSAATAASDNSKNHTLTKLVHPSKIKSKQACDAKLSAAVNLVVQESVSNKLSETLPTLEPPLLSVSPPKNSIEIFLEARSHVSNGAAKVVTADAQADYLPSTTRNHMSSNGSVSQKSTSHSTLIEVIPSNFSPHPVKLLTNSQDCVQSGQIGDLACRLTETHYKAATQTLAPNIPVKQNSGISLNLCARSLVALPTATPNTDRCNQISEMRSASELAGTLRAGWKKLKTTTSQRSSPPVAEIAEKGMSLDIVCLDNNGRTMVNDQVRQRLARFSSANITSVSARQPTSRPLDYLNNPNAKSTTSDLPISRQLMWSLIEAQERREASYLAERRDHVYSNFREGYKQQAVGQTAFQIKSAPATSEMNRHSNVPQLRSDAGVYNLTTHEASHRVIRPSQVRSAINPAMPDKTVFSAPAPQIPAASQITARAHQSSSRPAISTVPCNCESQLESVWRPIPSEQSDTPLHLKLLLRREIQSLVVPRIDTRRNLQKLAEKSSRVDGLQQQLRNGAVPLNSARQTSAARPFGSVERDERRMNTHHFHLSVGSEGDSVMQVGGSGNINAASVENYRHESRSSRVLGAVGVSRRQDVGLPSRGTLPEDRGVILLD